MNYATVDDMTILWRAMNAEEQERAKRVLTTVSAELRVRAREVEKDLDAMVSEDPDMAEIARSVTVDVAARVLMTSTDAEPMTQFSQTALGYTAQGTYLVPGGGLFIKNSELKRLGLRRQRYGAMEVYENAAERDIGHPV